MQRIPIAIGVASLREIKTQRSIVISHRARIKTTNNESSLKTSKINSDICMGRDIFILFSRTAVGITDAQVSLRLKKLEFLPQ